VTDAKSMQRTPVHKHPTAVGQSKAPDGAFVRRCSVTGGVVYSALVVVLFAVAPELRTFAPVWFLWMLVVAGAVGTYAAGTRMRSRTDRPIQMAAAVDQDSPALANIA
jgi:multisubunit Na+/H+ antiporter MnhB subunit